MAGGFGGGGYRVQGLKFSSVYLLKKGNRILFFKCRVEGGGGRGGDVGGGGGGGGGGGEKKEPHKNVTNNYKFE